MIKIGMMFMMQERRTASFILSYCFMSSYHMADSFSSLEDFPSGFVKFLSQCFFQGNQRGDKTVADQKEYFVTFVFIVDMRRGITFPQHEKPHRGIVYKAVLIAEL